MSSHGMNSHRHTHILRIKGEGSGDNDPPAPSPSPSPRCRSEEPYGAGGQGVVQAGPSLQASAPYGIPNPPSSSGTVFSPDPPSSPRTVFSDLGRTTSNKT